jgi:hypothetical protein
MLFDGQTIVPSVDSGLDKSSIKFFHSSEKRPNIICMIYYSLGVTFHKNFILNIRSIVCKYLSFLLLI